MAPLPSSRRIEYSPILLFKTYLARCKEGIYFSSSSVKVIVIFGAVVITLLQDCENEKGERIEHEIQKTRME